MSTENIVSILMNMMTTIKWRTEIHHLPRRNTNQFLCLNNILFRRHNLIGPNKKIPLSWKALMIQDILIINISVWLSALPSIWIIKRFILNLSYARSLGRQTKHYYNQSLCHKYFYSKAYSDNPIIKSSMKKKIVLHADVLIWFINSHSVSNARNSQIQPSAWQENQTN